MQHGANVVGSRSCPVRFLGQDYDKLHQDFVRHRARFLDSSFPPEQSSIGPGILSAREAASVVWIRPTKMINNPQLVIGGESRFDYTQGELGNCWFLAAIGAITFQKDIMDQVVPAGQTFTKDYAGIFHFRFWRFGKWVDVVIDDKLPTINGRLIFVHCKTLNEFWPALLEKAYAKLCGSYADMSGGYVSEALTDFTGGVHMTLRLAEGHPELWNLMYSAARYKSVMGCGTPPGTTPANTELSNGIVEGHAYTVTGVTKVMSHSESVKLVRVLNPWGHTEWNGNWSDGSPLWNTVSEENRTRWFHSKEDGEFWMSMEDFCGSFATLDICCFSAAFLDGSSPGTWTSAQYEDCWDTNTSGGSMGHMESFWRNPQYRVKIPALSPDSQETQGWNLLVSLMQKPVGKHRDLQPRLHIGLGVFPVPPGMKDQKGFPASFFASNAPVREAEACINTREVMESFRLSPGAYLIVPYTRNPNETSSFILTVHSKSKYDH
ncbi:calpain-2 catalytic subunit-like [Brachyhypopomus gauderio]|uniref:calpain-2 catalytic subunit-like n=1 Tax=Brachyhypopomus gauderio TaxID=698409 RepID=UPI0040426052